MKRFVCTLLLLCSVLPLCTASASAVDVSAKAFVLLDADSGRVLLGENTEREMAIASTTKIMTALVALEQKSLLESITVKAEHLKEGSSMYLCEGECLTLEELLYGLLLPSGNDASECIAALCGGDSAAFAEKMNEKAAALGLRHTAFANPSGLDADGHYSCALDLARLMACAMRNESFFRLCSTASASIGGRTMSNHNKLLLTLSGCIGGKTGYTSLAGRTLVSCCERDGMRLIAVTLCDGNDWADHTALYEYGFSAFHAQTSVSYGTVCGRVSVRGGEVSSVAAFAASGFSCAVGSSESLSTRTELKDTLTAPVAYGEEVGTMHILLNGTEIGTVPLHSVEAVAQVQEKNEGLLLRALLRLFGE